MTMIRLDALTDLAARALERSGANVAMAAATARALVYADAHGLASHGVSRVPQYALHLTNGRADGAATPRVAHARGGAALVDAQCGLAFPACAFAVEEAIKRSRECGVAFVGVTNSHHFGATAYHLEAVGEASLVGLALGNSPAAMAMAGGRHPLFGTNPIAAVFPRRTAAPLLIDLSLSEVARGKLMVAAKEGKAIPLGLGAGRGWPSDDRSQGRAHGLHGADGGAKGAMLALVVELLVTALTGAAMGFEATSFFVDEGNRPRLGQAFLVIDPDALAGPRHVLSIASRHWSRRWRRIRASGCRARAGARSPRRPAPTASTFLRRSSRNSSVSPDNGRMNPTITRPVALLLNVAHAVDHMFLLIFATAVAAIAPTSVFAIGSR
jgi:(2R)-3-sulfolactate dehydrogenase (NADP+)